MRHADIKGPLLRTLQRKWTRVFAGIVWTGLAVGCAELFAASAQMTIALPSAPTRTEQFAARELAKYLALSADVKTTIVAAPVKHTASDGVFWVGNLSDRDRLAKNGFPLDRLRDAKLQDDGVCIDGDGKHAILVGQGERGAMNAVYTYLENVVGCHWPDPGQEFVPKADDWMPAPFHIVVKPQFTYRGIAIHDGACNKEYFAKILDWLAKNRMNGFQIFPNHYDLVRPHVLDLILDRGLMPNIGGHSREHFLASGKYRPEHPDWFATSHGVKTGQLCYSNFDSVPTYASNVVEYLKARPEITMVSLWPNDGYGFCECPRCKAVAGNGSDLLLAYVNKVAERVHAELPHVKIEFLAYIHYLSAPARVKPLPYVVPTYCEHYGSIGQRDHFHPITQNLASNRCLREELEKWISISTQVTQFSYYGDDCIKRFLYHPIPEVIVADYRYYANAGLAGNFVLFTNPESWWSHAATGYACARSAWDRDLDSKRIEADYYRSLYGPAAEAMQRHADEVRSLYTFGISSADAEDRDARLRKYADAIQRARASLDLAKSQAANSYALERIRKLRAATDYLELWFQILCDQQWLSVEKSARLQKQILDNIDRALKLEIVVQDDGRVCDTAAQTLKRIRHEVAAIAPNTP